MKRLLSVPFLLVLALCASASEKPRVSRGMLHTVESSLDGRITRLWDDNPFVLPGPTRGIYLEGYGAVFSVEVNLVTAPTMMMRPELSREEKEHHRQKKIERLPQLRSALRAALADSAASLDTVPGDEEVVIAALLSHYGWEDSTGLPSQIMMQAQKKKLLEAKASGGDLAAVIRVTEN
jgi:hypothetical protein